MEIKIELDMPGIIAQACAVERLQPLVDKAITDALKSAIDDATGYRSEFRKSLVVQLMEALPHGLGEADLAKFQHVLNAAVIKHVHDANTTTVETAFNKLIVDVLPDIPAVIKLSDLVKMARDGFHKESHETFYAYWEASDYGGGWLYLDGDVNPSKGYGGKTRDRKDMKYSAKLRLAVNKEGVAYALRLNDVDVTPAARPDVIGTFDSTLMAMYVGRTKLEIDWDDDDVRCEAQEQYD